MDKGLDSLVGGGFVKAECNTRQLLFQEHGKRQVVAAFEGGSISAEAGGLLLRDVGKRFGILRSFEVALTDFRDPEPDEFCL